MAVRRERPHAELLGSGETFPVVLLGSIKVRGIALRPRLAENPVGIGLVAAFALLFGQLEGPNGDRERASWSPSPHVPFREPDESEGLVGH